MSRKAAGFAVRKDERGQKGACRDTWDNAEIKMRMIMAVEMRRRY